MANLKLKYVYLIEIKLVLSSTFAALFYLSLVLLAILIQSPTLIQSFVDSKHHIHVRVLTTRRVFFTLLVACCCVGALPIPTPHTPMPGLREWGHAILWLLRKLGVGAFGPDPRPKV